MTSNPYCQAIGIDVPSIERVVGHREANAFSLLVAALLEHGQPMTLLAVAQRLERAGWLPAERGLVALSRCRPARTPVFREDATPRKGGAGTHPQSGSEPAGARYGLALRDPELDWMAFRLDLRPPRLVGPGPAAPAPPPPEPPPGPGTPLSRAEVERALRGAWVTAWPLQRLVVAALDAHGGPMEPAAVIAYLTGLAAHLPVELDTPKRRWPSRSAVQTDPDGRWAMVPGHVAIPQARDAVRAWILKHPQVALGNTQERIAAAEARRKAHAAELAALRRAVVCGFPVADPRVVAILDVGRHDLTTFLDEPARVRARLGEFDVLAGLELRPMLRALGVDPDAYRLHDLGPPQKTLRLNRAGRVLDITVERLMRGSCGVSIGDRKTLARYLDDGAHTKLRRRLEADAKALHALYQYGRLHHVLRLRWGFLDEWFRVPWADPDEPSLHALAYEALETSCFLEVVVGAAPSWADPWARGVRCEVILGDSHADLRLVSDGYVPLRLDDVQAARIVDDTTI